MIDNKCTGCKKNATHYYSYFTKGDSSYYWCDTCIKKNWSNEKSVLKAMLPIAKTITATASWFDALPE